MVVQSLKSGEYDGVACQVFSCAISATRMGSCSESRSVEVLAIVWEYGGGGGIQNLGTCISHLSLCLRPAGEVWWFVSV